MMYDDHVIVSIDWSQIELVLIGEFSGDPYYHECYGKLPYRDLHEIAAATCLEVEVETFRCLKKNVEFLEQYGAEHPLLTTPKGDKLDPKKAYKWWRTEVGKGSNFNYAFSGALSTVGERLGWTSEEMWSATERYREKFAVAEQWRVSTIMEAAEFGYVTLPDGHRRTRFEATDEWKRQFRAKWERHGDPSVLWFADQVIKRTQTRAGNQAVNAKIQGSCATLAKRSIPASNRALSAKGWGPREFRFMLLVHDELVFSVHRDLVRELVETVRGVMCNHPEIISTLAMDCSPSVGLTFEPWTEKSRLGQIELFEAPDLPFVPRDQVGGKLAPELWGEVVNWLFSERTKL